MMNIVTNASMKHWLRLNCAKINFSRRKKCYMQNTYTEPKDRTRKFQTQISGYVSALYGTLMNELKLRHMNETVLSVEGDNFQLVNSFLIYEKFTKQFFEVC